MKAIKISQVSKTLGRTKRIDDLSFEIEAGEIFALLGPNGAGKTTAIKLLTGMLKPDDGKVDFMGLDPIKDKKEVRRKIGLVPQETSLYPELSAVDNLSFHAALYMPEIKNAKKRISEILELVELKERSKEPVKTYSGGMKRRLAIGRALLSNPEVLILDEPTLGVDVQGTHRIWDYIKQFSKQGKTVLVTTNVMQEADYLSDRILIIDHGKKIVSGSSPQLKSQLGEDQIVITPKPGVKLPLEKIKEKTGEFRIDNRNNLIFKGVKGDKTLINIVSELSKLIEIDSVEMKKPSLDDVFLYYTGRSLRD